MEKIFTRKVVEKEFGVVAFMLVLVIILFAIKTDQDIAGRAYGLPNWSISGEGVLFMEPKTVAMTDGSGKYVKIIVKNIDYINKFGYVYKENSWKRFDFDQDTIMNTTWIPRYASVRFRIEKGREETEAGNLGEFKEGEYPVIIYACNRSNNSLYYNCSGDKWMIGSFKVAYLPDLIISNISAFNKIDARRYYVNASIGGIEGQRVVVDISLNTHRLSQHNVTLTRNVSTFSFNFDIDEDYLVSGQNDIKVMVDPGNAVEESNEENNARITSFQYNMPTVPLPPGIMSGNGTGTPGVPPPYVPPSNTTSNQTFNSTIGDFNQTNGTESEFIIREDPVRIQQLWAVSEEVILGYKNKDLGKLAKNTYASDFANDFDEAYSLGSSNMTRQQELSQIGFIMEFTSSMIDTGLEADMFRYVIEDENEAMIFTEPRVTLGTVYGRSYNVTNITVAVYIKDPSGKMKSIYTRTQIKYGSNSNQLISDISDDMMNNIIDNDADGWWDITEVAVKSDPDDNSSLPLFLYNPVVMCSNAVLDYYEASIDCGGECSKCTNANNCLNNIDCVSGICESHVCVGARTAVNCLSYSSYTKDEDAVCCGENQLKVDYMALGVTSMIAIFSGGLSDDDDGMSQWSLCCKKDECPFLGACVSEGFLFSDGSGICKGGYLIENPAVKEDAVMLLDEPKANDRAAEINGVFAGVCDTNTEWCRAENPSATGDGQLLIDWGDGAKTCSNLPTKHNYENPGSYYIYASGKDKCGNDAIEGVNVKVNFTECINSGDSTSDNGRRCCDGVLKPDLFNSEFRPMYTCCKEEQCSVNGRCVNFNYIHTYTTDCDLTVSFKCLASRWSNVPVS